MITIHPADKAFLEGIDAPAGTDAMVLRDGDGTVIGHGLFRLDGDTIEVLAVQAQESLLVDGIIRSILNTGDCRGASFGICRIAELEKVLRRLEFTEENGLWSVSIQHFFRGECHCS